MGRTRQLRLLPTVKKELTLWKCLDAGLYFFGGKALVLADFQKKIDGDLTSAVRWGVSLLRVWTWGGGSPLHQMSEIGFLRSQVGALVENSNYVSGV